MKRVPSNRMPHYEAPPLGWEGRGFVFIFLAAFAAVAVTVLVQHPVIAAICGGILTLLIPLAYFDIGSRTKSMRAEREGMSICQFARAIDCRSVDTWIVRAVYEELTLLTGFPIKADDELDKILEWDDDVDFAVEPIAQRCGRTLEQTTQNPWHERVRTPMDMVFFFAHQPLEAGHAR